ncbi:hypothetical protein VKT23_016046 [Stygiomarasmius scandens]|uniref:SGNH hydrolase-type esterase domain-containing protein n=1 Tax=Marasmiellus scandens TaxID=2682957 RepID=A0ABR1IXX5_9AGAR
MAIGGASTSNDLVPSFATGPGGINIAIPGIDDQVAEFLNSTQDFDSEKPLIVLYGGLNDVNFNFDISPTQVFLSLMKSKARLEAAYPQAEFLFLDYPDLSLIPFNFYLGGLNQSQLGTFSRGLTRLFEDMMVNNTLNEKANTHFVSFLDLFGQWDYSRQPRLYGFDALGAYGSCLVGVYHESDEITLCDDPDSMVYFDKYHASGRAHFWMGRKVLQWLSVRA